MASQPCMYIVESVLIDIYCTPKSFNHFPISTSLAYEPTALQALLALSAAIFIASATFLSVTCPGTPKDCEIS